MVGALIRNADQTMRGITLFSMFLIGLVLASCSSGPSRVEICPIVSFVDGLDKVTVFGADGGADLANVLYAAEVTQLAATCRFNRDGATISAEFLLIADRGLGDRERIARPDYFVAVTNPAGNIMAKEVFQAEIPFTDNRRRVGRKEEIEPFLPYQGHNGDFTGYRVLIGFQLSAEQVEFNKRYQR
jgi:hypothetical protein